MYNRGIIITGLIIFFILLLFPVWYHWGRATAVPDPQLADAYKKAEKCIEDKDFMKTQHMKVLDRWRNEVVRDAERYYTNSEGKMYDKSLQVTCMKCHSNKSQFCDQCHNYMGVSPFCWDCHVAPKENM